MGSEEAGMFWNEIPKEPPDDPPPDQHSPTIHILNSKADKSKSNIISNQKLDSYISNYIKSFSGNDLGPFYIYMEGIQGNIGNLHPMSIGRKIKNECSSKIKENILNIAYMGKNKLKIEFKNYGSANAFLESEMATNFKTYIPLHLVTRRGVIKYVDPNLDTEYLKKYLESPVAEIVDIKRFKIAKRDKQGNIIRDNAGNVLEIMSSTVIITFRGKYLPETVILDYTKCKVYPYVPKVIRCKFCLGYNHVAQQCKSSKARCGICSQSHETNTCQNINSPSCVYCKNEGKSHSTLDRKCPRFALEKQIKENMAYKNISYKMAKEEICKRSYYDVLIGLNDENEFPDLQNSQQSSMSVNRYRNRENKSISQNYKYNNKRKIQEKPLSQASNNELIDRPSPPKVEKKKSPMQSTADIETYYFKPKRTEEANCIDTESETENSQRKRISQENIVDKILYIIKYFKNNQNIDEDESKKLIKRILGEYNSI